MNDITIEELTQLKIKEYFKIKEENKNRYYKLSKTELIDFCIDLIKIIKFIDENIDEK